ncbi:hypothetical protein DY000_02060088 [Brassica cretica]|uniref:Uncharacterized protein n=1 Tax=Brassica cretica TaxID=69181 RepID=A0ABQ7B014_BRACR|nr:hypothetical protein DY000_02060088 [Brassica cretica]
MCVKIPSRVRVHVFSNRYSQDKAYTFTAKMRSVEGYVRRYLVRCRLDGQVAKYMEVPIKLALIGCGLQNCTCDGRCSKELVSLYVSNLFHM